MIRYSLTALMLFGAACTPGVVVGPDDDCDDDCEVEDTASGDTAEADADTDSDTDSDTDTDADSDSDSDADVPTDADGDGYDTAQPDCDDSDATVYPGADEICDDKDNDCDTYVDEGLSCDEETDEWSDYIWTDGDDVYFSDDGFSDDVYLSPAYMVGYGGDLDWSLDSSFLESNVSGSFAFDTSGWDEDCYEAVLVSSLQTEDDETYTAATSIDNTADWWDNHELCESESATADSWCAHQTGEDYLIAFCVTSSGVVPDGDGI